MITGGEWHPGIGDPSLAGWTITTGYLFSAVSCAIVSARPAVRASAPAARRFWQVLAGVLLLLGINKQLDLQTFLWLTGRRMAREQGWYDERIWVQATMVLFVGIGGLVLLVLLARMSRYEYTEAKVAMIGMIFLCCFVLVRTISIANVDRLLAVQLGDWNVNRILELAGVSIVLFASMVAVVRPRVAARRCAR